RWCASLLSTFFLPTTSESSLGDSLERPLHSSLHSAGPSRKRCRSPADSVSSSTPVMRSLAPIRADLLPPRKRFRDSYSSETSMEEDTEIDTTETEDGRELDIVNRNDARDRVKIDPRDVKDDTEEYEADTSAGDTVKVGIDPMSAPVADEESEEPVGVHWLLSKASGERARMTERIERLRLENLKVRAMLSIKRDRVDSLRLYMSRSQEEFRQIRYDRDDLRRKLRRLESFAERRLGFRP
nr:hypothetical protein [Tanacetum cinerariifolium]